MEDIYYGDIDIISLDFIISSSPIGSQLISWQ
jgi:hypothetical protein